MKDTSGRKREEMNVCHIMPADVLKKETSVFPTFAVSWAKLQCISMVLCVNMTGLKDAQDSR